MDFSSQLANLQKTASAAQRGSNGNNSNSSINRNRDNSQNGNGSNSRPNNRHHKPPPDHQRRQAPSSYPPRDSGRHTNNGRNNYYGRQPDPKRQRRDAEGPYRNPKWNNLKHAVDSLPKFQPPTETRPCAHLCLLAITINELPFEDIWRDWAQRQSITVSLICHAKEPNKIQSEWLKSHVLVEPPRIGRGNDFAPPTYRTRYPQWGSIEITLAMLDLCDESLKVGCDADMKDLRFSTNRYGFDAAPAAGLPQIDKVLFISETCLPVASLTEELLLSSSSIVNARDTPNNGFSRQLQFEKIHSLVPLKFKADQWMMLSRPHLEFLMTRMPRNFWECFQDCNASDELYFPTALALLGIVAKDSSEVVTRRITYTDWSMGPKNPATFETKDLKRVVEEAGKEGCLVARKFVGISVQEWKDVVFPAS